RIDAAGRRIVFSNAGHNPPLLLRPDGTAARLSDGGMVIGVFPDNAYEQSELPLASGDRLLFYTDGITEARSPGGDEYDELRLLETARAVRHEPVEAMKDALLDDVNGFTGGHFDDDATLIVVGIP